MRLDDDGSSELHRRSAGVGLAARMRRWLASGACQSGNGAFVAWRDAALDRLAFEYPEITGYALTYLNGLEQPSEHEIAVGRSAADWLVGRIGSGDLSARSDWDGGAVYHFDLAIIASGLMSFGRRSRVERYVASGLELAKCLRSAWRRDGQIPALGHASAGRSTRDAWSTRGSAHLIKCVQALLIADELGTDGMLEVAASLVGGLGMVQRADGRICTHPDDRETMLHPMLYACEGLWMWGSARSDREALTNARQAVDWVWRHQLSIGGFPDRVASATSAAQVEEASDVTAQAIRLALLLDTRPTGLSRALSRLGELTFADDKGVAVTYRPDSKHQNVWCTMFAAQALALAGRPTAVLPWADLI